MILRRTPPWAVFSRAAMHYRRDTAAALLEAVYLQPHDILLLRHWAMPCRRDMLSRIHAPAAYSLLISRISRHHN